MRWRDSLGGRGMAPKTINRRVSSVSSFYKYLQAVAAEMRLPIVVPNPAHAQFIGRASQDPVDETRALTSFVRTIHIAHLVSRRVSNASWFISRSHATPTKAYQCREIQKYEMQDRIDEFGRVLGRILPKVEHTVGPISWAAASTLMHFWSRACEQLRPVLSGRRLARRAAYLMLYYVARRRWTQPRLANDRPSKASDVGSGIGMRTEKY